MKGWVKLHRKIMDNPIVFKDSEYLAVWIYLLLNATHTEIPAIFKGEKIILQPGQLITGRRAISDKLNVSESKVQRILKWFEIDLQIEQQASNKNRLITILNWDMYQNSEQQNETPTDCKETSNEQQSDTNNNVRMKESNNVRKIFIPPTLEEVIAYCHERNNNVDPERFIDFYNAKGWMVGKNKMKDWKAAVRTWERNSKKEIHNKERDTYDDGWRCSIEL